MTKETFILNAFRLLLSNPSVSLDEMNFASHNISRATAWRVLNNLRKAGYVILSGEWSITQQGREWFCGSCNYRKRCMKVDQERHLEISKVLQKRARHPT